MFAEWARTAWKFTGGVSQAEIARRMTALLRRRIDTAAVNKIIGGTRALGADEMLAMAEITGYPVIINLEGALLDRDAQGSGLNESYLVKLFSFALEWKGLPPDAARNLSAALLAAARKHPDRQGIELTDDQLRQVALALTAALGPQLPR